MSVPQTFVTLSASEVPIIRDTEQMARLGTQAIFRACSAAMTQQALGQMERRERIILLLLDGKRTLEDITRLTHRCELEVARILVSLLLRGFIEFLDP